MENVYELDEIFFIKVQIFWWRYFVAIAYAGSAEAKFGRYKLAG
jgi:hypothetical protein